MKNKPIDHIFYINLYEKVSKELEYFPTMDVAKAAELNNQTVRNCRDKVHYTRPYNLLTIANVIGVS